MTKKKEEEKEKKPVVQLTGAPIPEEKPEKE